MVNVEKRRLSDAAVNDLLRLFVTIRTYITPFILSHCGGSYELGSLTTKFGPISEIGEKPNKDKY